MELYKNVYLSLDCIELLYFKEHFDKLILRLKTEETPHNKSQVAITCNQLLLSLRSCCAVAAAATFLL